MQTCLPTGMGEGDRRECTGAQIMSDKKGGNAAAHTILIQKKKGNPGLYY